MAARPSRPQTILLEPRNPFSWKIVLALVVAWIVALIAIFGLKMRVLTALLPLLAIIFVVYITVCTVILIRNRR